MPHCDTPRVLTFFLRIKIIPKKDQAYCLVLILAEKPICLTAIADRECYRRNRVQLAYAALRHSEGSYILSPHKNYTKKGPSLLPSPYLGRETDLPYSDCR